MEKLLYPLWKQEGVDADAFRQTLLEEVAPKLLSQQGVRALRLNVVDSAVAAAESLRQATITEPLDAMFSIWVDSANDRSALDAAVAPACREYAAYLVTESVPLVNDAPLGERMPGWTQVVYLERPSGMSEADWLSVWKGSHTSVAIETQSTFAYRQNVVTQRLSEGAVGIHAVVEESFPEAAMDSPMAFYDADSEDMLQARVKAMIDSCARFINFERINVVPTSEYLLKAL
ncbi:MAG: hypothetical protein V2J89_15615 [Halieaceae bacterium]|jgi:hypothetical protein|nr:hypothetical protein [Halieaceae bacterium]